MDGGSVVTRMCMPPSPGLGDLSGLRVGTAAHVLGQLERVSLPRGLLTLQFLQGDGAVQTSV